MCSSDLVSSKIGAETGTAGRVSPGVLWHLGSGHDGWGAAGGLGWYTADLQQPLFDTPLADFGVLRVRPIVAGASYTRHVRRVALTASLLGGYAFNTFTLRPSFSQAYRAAVDGRVVERTFKSGDSAEGADVVDMEMQYLYNDGSSYVFMDTSTYEQLEVAPEIVGDAKNFMLENQEAIVATNEGRVLFIELPASVELLIAETEPGLQGDRSTGGTKPATLETGHTIAVPLFITTGEKVKVDTRDSSYLGRVKA